MSTVDLSVQANAKPSPSPHSLALVDQDLLALIFSSLLPDDPTTLPREEVVARRKHLRDAALVCKAFKDPALDRLWTYLDSLLPLIKLLPNLTVLNKQYVSPLLYSVALRMKYLLIILPCAVLQWSPSRR